MKDHHDILLAIVIKKQEDYDPWGTNTRWSDPQKAYPDCACGCKHYYPLKDIGKQELSFDWGICSNPESHRGGLLTFEHQGCQKFEQ